jgi:hypothetical protein
MTGRAGVTLLLMFGLAAYALAQLAGAAADRRRGRTAKGDRIERCIRTDRVLAVVVVPSGPLDPETVADDLGGSVLHSDDATSTLLLTYPEGAVEQLLLRLEPVGVISHHVIASGDGELVVSWAAADGTADAARATKSDNVLV